MSVAVVPRLLRGRAVTSLHAVTTRRATARGAADVDWDLPDRAGPLTAVVGLCGGAGASTLTYLVAASASARRRTDGTQAAVLACDAGERNGGLSVCAGVRSKRSLPETARALARGETPREPFAIPADGLRLIAGPGDPPGGVDPQSLTRVVSDARQAHCLTVVDCGTLAEPAQQLALEAATHVIWMLPATRAGLLRAAHAAGSLPQVDAGSIVVARHDPSTAKARTRDLAAFAREREAPLVLMPQVPGVDGGDPAPALVVAEVPLQALASWLSRYGTVR